MVPVLCSTPPIHVSISRVCVHTLATTRSSGPTDEEGKRSSICRTAQTQHVQQMLRPSSLDSVHARRTTPGDAAALHNIRVCVSRVPHPNTVCVLRQSLSGETSRWAYAGMYHGRLLQLLLEVRGGSILRSHMPEEALERWSPVQV